MGWQTPICQRVRRTLLDIMGWQTPICQRVRRTLLDKVGWQTIFLLKRSETFNGLANSDLPKSS